MGVSGLRKHVLNSHRSHVCIRSFIERERKKVSTAEPVIVVDGSNFLHPLYHGLPCKPGGSFQRLERRVTEVVKVFKEMGARLVFFFDGNDDSSRREFWIWRKQRIQGRIAAIYSNMVGCSEMVHPAGVFETIILTLKRLGVEVHLTSENGDAEIARYSRREECLAVLSADTDFVLLPGVRHVLSCAEYDMPRGWTVTVGFDREQIAAALGLHHSDDLALLGALLPNDFISEDDALRFYSQKGLPQTTNFKSLIHALARLLSDFNLNKSKKDRVHDLLRGINHNLKKKLLKSIEMYDYFIGTDAARTGSSHTSAGDPGCEPSRRIAAQMLWHAEVLPELHMLVEKHIIEMSPSLEDPELPDAGRAETALRPLRAHIYGLLNINEPVSEWYPKATYEQVAPVSVNPIPLGKSSGLLHPGLEALWTGRGLKDPTGSVRWKLMAWALLCGGPRHPEAARWLRELSHTPRLVAPAAALLALHQSEALNCLPSTPKDNLIRLAIACAVVVDGATEAFSSRESPYSRETMHLAALFMRTYTHILLLSDVIGHPIPRDQMSPALFFDGKVFQNVCEQYKDDRVKRTKSCYALLNIVTSISD